MKAKTKIHCNGCKYLKTIKRKIKKGTVVDRNTLMLFCTALEDYHIDTIESENKDLHNAGMPYIEAPWDCPFRQQERINNNEEKFETSIN